MNPPSRSVRLKFTVSKIGSGKTPFGGAETYVPSGVMIIRSQNVHFDGLHLDDVAFVDEETDEQMASTRVQPDDVLLNITGASLGRCTVVPKNTPRANVNQHVCILRPDKRRVIPEFLNLALQSSQVQSAIFAGENGSSREGLTFDQIGNLEIFLPSINEQRSIAGYLVQETGRLEGLIAEKKKWLESLEEKRRALIAEALTRGLNPKSPTKNSGVEWLGKIPANWETRRVKYLFRLILESAPADHDFQLLSVYTDIGVRPRKELEARGNKASSTEDYWMVRPGDIIVNKLLAWMGAFGVSEYEGVTSPAYDILRPKSGVDSTYYHYLFRCGICFTEFRRRSTGIMDMRLRLYFDKFGDMRVPFPPLDEQRVIVAYIGTATAKLDALRAATERTIALLKERRAALIAAAVTGQLKVN